MSLKSILPGDIIRLFNSRGYAPKGSERAGAYVLINRVAKAHLGFLPQETAYQWLYLLSLWFWETIEPKLLPSASRDLAVLPRVLPKFQVWLSDRNYDIDIAYNELRGITCR